MALSDEDFHELQQQAVSVSEMADHPGWAIVTDRIKQQVADRQTRMIGGTVKDWDDYRKCADWLECALWVLRLPDLVAFDVEQHRSLRADYNHSVDEEEAT